MSEQKLKRLQCRRIDLRAAMQKLLTDVETRGAANLTPAETSRFEQLRADVVDIDQQIEDLQFDLARSGRYDPTCRAIMQATADNGSGWAHRAADVLGFSENRAIASGSVDVPSLVSPAVTAMSRPKRLIDLLVNRMPLDGNAFEYFRQTVRTNNATAVADGAVKPTSTFTVAPITDRARVIAHLSEPVPIRLWQDATEVVLWLESEMVEGVLDALEAQIIAGTGSGENMTGLLHVGGTTAVPYATDVPTTLRKARTALENLGVTSDLAWVLNPADAEAIDLLRYSIAFDPANPTTSAQSYLLDGYANGVAQSANVFGEHQRVISKSVPAGTAVLGDWKMLKLYVREQMSLMIDASGDLFTKNEAIMRAEMRAGVGHLRPASFAVIDLTP